MPYNIPGGAFDVTVTMVYYLIILQSLSFRGGFIGGVGGLQPPFTSNLTKIVLLRPSSKYQLHQ